MPKTVLIVDDEQVVADISRRKLSQLGYDAVVAYDGQQALNWLKSKVPDLIVLDVQMPNMNGYTFIMEKAKIPGCANVPVVVLSAYNENEPLFQRHKVSAYLLKPLKLQELLDKVAELIGPPA